MEEELQRAINDLIKNIDKVAPPPKETPKELCNAWGNIYFNLSILKHEIDELCK